MTTRTVAVLAAMLCAAPPTILAAQQVADSVRVAPAGVAQAPVTTPDSSTAGPRIAPPAARLAPATLNLHSTSGQSYYQEGRSHTFTISTLALVLGIIIIVLLI